MTYRELGKTGKKISTIGLGCEYLDGKPYEQVQETLDAALAGGMNLLDVFMPGREVRENIARALGERRKDVYIQGHIGSTDINRQYDISRDIPTVKKYFEELLKMYGYIDFGMLFYIDSDEDYRAVFETDFIKYVEKLKRDGDIHHIGFSSHNPVTAARIVETGVAEIILFSINPAFDMLPDAEDTIKYMEGGYKKETLEGVSTSRTRLYQMCVQRGIGITVMKAFGSGKLLSPDLTPFSAPLTVNQCLHYALANPAVVSVLPGCKTPAEIADVLTYFNSTDEEKDCSALVTIKDFRGACVYCSHCQPCPVGLDVAAIHRFLDAARLGKTAPPPQVHPQTCTACGHCEARCPFQVPIIKNLKESESYLCRFATG
jgi:predicted aldo/keto reductase-like oxidoreductase